MARPINPKVRTKAIAIERMIKNGLDIETIMREASCTRQDVYNVRYHLKKQAALKNKPKKNAEVKYIFRNADGVYETETTTRTSGADPLATATRELIKQAESFGMKVRIEFYSD